MVVACDDGGLDVGGVCHGFAEAVSGERHVGRMSYSGLSWKFQSWIPASGDWTALKKDGKSSGAFSADLFSTLYIDGLLRWWGK